MKQVPCKLFDIFFSYEGRGVDLNRNWSVDWGKKEKVCVPIVYRCAPEKPDSFCILLYISFVKIHLNAFLNA
jgi:hypothetical protein